LPSPGVDELVPTPRNGKPSPSQKPGPDGFTVGIDEAGQTGQPPPIEPRPAKQSKVRQKPDSAEKLNLTICQGC
jgi:hypothetical protein